jgi:hypothetical protein
MKRRRVSMFVFLVHSMIAFSRSAGIAGVSTIASLPDSLVLLQDFRINDIAGKGSLGQTDPDVATGRDGNGVLAWIDGRAGDSYYRDLYCQRFSREKGFIGENIWVNEIVSTVSGFCSVAMDSAGGFLIVWTDERKGRKDVYGQRFSVSGERLGPNFKVNQISTVYVEAPNVAFCPDGRFVIVWMTFEGIHAKIFSNDGSTLAEDFVVSGPAQPYVEFSTPAVSIYGKQNLMIVWCQGLRWEGASFNDIIAQQISMDGDLVGQPLMVNESSWRGDSTSPAVSVDCNGNFVVAWKESEYRSSLQARFFDKYHQPIGPSFQFATISATAYGVFTDSQCNTVVWWTASDGQFWARRFSVNGDTMGVLNGFYDSTQTSYMAPSMVFFPSGGFVIAWSVEQNYNADVFLRLFDKNGATVLSPTKVSDDSGANEQKLPAIVADENGNWGVVWEDFRNGNTYQPNIFARSLDSDGNTIRPDFQVDDGVGYVTGSPRLCMGDSGRIFAALPENRDSRDCIFLRRYASLRDTIGKSTTVGGVSGLQIEGIECAAASNGRFIAVWLGRENWTTGEERAVYGIILDGNLNAVCPRITITDENLRLYYCEAPSAVLSNSKGDFIVFWSDGRNGEHNDDVFFQVVSGTGKKIGGNVKVNSDITETSQSCPAAVMLPDDRFVVSWTNRLNVYPEKISIDIRLYNDDYLPIGETRELLSADEGMWPDFLRLVGDNMKTFCAVWMDALANGVYGMFFDCEGGLKSPVYRMTDADRGTQTFPAAASTSDRIFLTWSDNRTGTTGTDIWGKAIKWMKPEGSAPGDMTGTGDIQISRNFPNPFSRTSIIQYQLITNATVQVKVFDTVGRLVKTPVHQFMDAGIHTLVLNSSDFSTGVYLCQFLANGRKAAVQKILVVK